MDFKRLYTSSTTYIILLITAIAVLLFTASMAFRQIKLTQESAEEVVHTLHVYNALGDLTAHCAKAESEKFQEDLLKNKSLNYGFESYKSDGKAIIDTLRILTQDNNIQTLRLKPLSELVNKLHNQLVSIEVVNNHDILDVLQARQSQKVKISNTLNDINDIKDRMLVHEKRLMQGREATYTFHKSLTPTMLIGMALFALVVFVISFFRIYFNKLKIKKSEAFLKSVLANTDNIVNYYEPIFNKGNQIIDFKIKYANNCNSDYLGLEPDDIIGKTVLNIYPFHGSFNELIELIQSYNEKSKVVFDRQIVVNDKYMWFHSIATPLDNGVLVTSRNSTPEEEAKEIELTFKKQLENQNSELLESRAFLTNIFKSIVHVVMHFKSIRGKDDNIIDFEILFINDRVNLFNVEVVEDIKNKKVSEIYPDIFNSEVFTHLVNAVESDKAGRYETPYYKNNTVKWYVYTAIKLGDGVTITIEDNTQEKEKANEIVKLNEDLVIQNSILIDAERIAKSGSFLWYLDKDIAEISDNFYHMLGYEPNEFEPTFEKYRELVHQDDLAEYDKNAETAMKEFDIQEHTYRVITKQGSIKYFKANGQFITKNGKKVMIGVVQDVTQTIVAEERLLKSNLELKHSNAELESFTRVASHDLQEPLRKIQLFTLRIEDVEGENLSSRSKEYFQKVTTAVKRMQSLIQNLLAYSRIDSTQKDFEKIDLNQVLNKVKDDLTNTINDLNAEVISAKLPKIKGVVFQMEQLFTNLISNALKYRNINEPPKIEIQYKKVKDEDIPKHFKSTKEFYHKISFQDNGIGFDSQHAEKIFEVFQRLHQKTEYTGTGIGLAICKKIVENHNGFIYAEGTLGVGSEFVVYLPV